MLRQANCVLALVPYLGADFYHHANYFFFLGKINPGRQTFF